MPVSGRLAVSEQILNQILYWLTLAISKRQRRKALSLTAYTAVKSSKTEKNFVREYKVRNCFNTAADILDRSESDEGWIYQGCGGYTTGQGR